MWGVDIPVLFIPIEGLISAKSLLTEVASTKVKARTCDLAANNSQKGPAINGGVS